MGKTTVFVIVVFASMASGCVYSDAGEDNRIAFDWNITETADEEYRISGFLYSKSWRHNNTISDLKLLLFDRDGDIIFEKSHGLYHTENNKYVNVTVGEKPKYVIFSAPTIWDLNNIRVEHYVLTSEGYYDTRVASDWKSLPINSSPEYR